MANSKTEQEPLIPRTPEVRPGFRDDDYVQPVMLRMGTGFVDALDQLCAANERSRRVIIEKLIERAYEDFANNNARI